MASIELGRYKIVTDKRELLLPACSFFNRADSEPYYVDTDYDVEEGRIYIGASDIEDMARTIGWIEGSAYKALCQKYELLEAKYGILVGALNDLGVNLDTIRAIVDSIISPTEEPAGSSEQLPDTLPLEPSPEPSFLNFELPESKLEGFDDPFAEP